MHPYNDAVRPILALYWVDMVPKWSPKLPPKLSKMDLVEPQETFHNLFTGFETKCTYGKFGLMDESALLESP